MQKGVFLLISFFVSSLCSFGQEGELKKTEKPHPAVAAVITWAEAFQKNGKVNPEEDILDPVSRKKMREFADRLGGSFDKEMGAIVIHEKAKLVFEKDQKNPDRGAIMVGKKRLFAMTQKEDRWFCDIRVFFQEVRDQTMRQTVYTDMQSILAALNNYKNLGGAFPSEKQGLGALFKRPTDDPRPRRWIQIADSEDAFKDPWGNLYQYKLVDGKPVLTSLGPDGKVSDDDLSTDD